MDSFRSKTLNKHGFFTFLLLKRLNSHKFMTYNQNIVLLILGNEQSKMKILKYVKKNVIF